MAFNGNPNPPPPPPPPQGHPPPPGGPQPPPPPPPPPFQMPFWDFVHSLDPNWAAGYGVDHTDPHFSNGFAFGPAGFEAWSGRGGFRGDWGRRGGWGGRGGWGWGGRGGRGGWDWGWGGPAGPWDESRGHHGRYWRRGEQSGDEEGPSGDDEEMRDVVTDNEKGGERDPEKQGTPGTMRDEGDAPDPPEEIPTPFPRHGRGGFGRRGGFGGRGGRRGTHHGSRGPHGRHFHGPPPPPGPGGPPPPYGAPWDFREMMNTFAQHPFAQRIRDYVESQVAQARGTREGAARGNETSDDDVDAIAGDDTFVPPVDIFNTANNWTIHIALPGAKKEDVALNFDAHKSTLAITGVVYRPGDEEFLAGMMNGERKVGLFERKFVLPPEGSDEKDEVDAEGITARMEDGILVVVVPKVEKDWTEVRKVDIQ